MRLHIYPSFSGEDSGDGGVRRVVEAQLRYLPDLGIDCVDDPVKADIIACHISIPSTYLVRFPEKPVVGHCHGLYWSDYDWGHNWESVANTNVMSLLRAADAVTAPSEWVAQAIRRATMRPVTVLNHGIDIAEWAPGKNEEYILWNKTRVDPVCDPTPVDAVAKLLPKRRFVSTFGHPTDNVLVTGKLPFTDAKEILSEAGVYLCTSRETFGIGTLEAMACGVPIVGYNWGGQREFLTHKENAWLVEPGDIAGLAEGIEWSITNRDDLSARVRAVAESFSWEKAVKQTAEVYTKVLAKLESRGPKVSVIVPAYGVEKYLSDCLESVARQTLSDLECIIVDDASTDNSGKIADDFATRDSRFRVIHKPQNEYLAAARNTGIVESTAQYIFPLDGDDILPPRTLEVLAGSLDSDKALHIAYGNVLFVEEDGVTPHDYHVKNQGAGHSGWPVEYRYDWQMEGPGQVLPYASMYRREVWEYTGGYRPRCRSSEDQDFWLRTVSYGFYPRMVTNADTLIYRLRETSMSASEGWRDHRRWYPWSIRPELAPAGAATEKQLPVPSLDPPLISIIIPVGPGHERYVLDAIDSVDAQTFRQWECIVVNDTGQPWCHKQNPLPSWVRLIESDQGHSVAHARNLGVAASRALLFLPLDADDFLQPFALEVMFQVWKDVGGVVYSDWWDEIAHDQTKIYHAPDWDPKLLTKKGAIHAVTALYPCSAWEEVGGFDEELVAWEDWDFALALADHGICGTRVPDPLWTYRKHTGMRRDANYGSFEESKKAILSKWGKLWEGGQELMACGGCPGGGGKRVRPQGLPTQVPPRNGEQNLDEVVLIEYTGPAEGARLYRGRVSGTNYRFSSLESERLKYVRKVDVEIFVNRMDFRILLGKLLPTTPQESETTPVLVAEGPPIR